MADAALLPGLYATLFAQGLLWTAGHCLGMCGPLLVAFRFGARGDGTVAGGAALGHLLCYQLGRMLALGAAGAALGWAGAVAQVAVRQAMPLATLAAAGLCLVLAAAEAGWLRLPAPSLPRPVARWAERAAGGARGPLRALALGLGLAFLPCAVTVWALGLAAASGHPLHGALLMAGLVLLTTPWLLVAVLVPAGLSRWRLLRGRLLVPLGLAVSGLILGVLAVRALLAPAGPVCHV